MSKIDWDKAPEGATHYLAAGNENARWRDLSGEKWRFFNLADGNWHQHCFSSDELLKRSELIARPAWNGEGLPPVGTVCEWHPNQDGWVQVKILGHDGEETWFRREGHSTSEACLRMAFFRPIRTAEQIAADERDKAVKEMYARFSGIGGLSLKQCIWVISEGYRKQEAP